MVERPAQEGVALMAVVPSSFAPDAAQAAPAIAGLWEELCRRRDTDINSPDVEFIGVSTPADDLVPPHRITYVATAIGHGIVEPAAGLERYHLDGGLYVVFTYRGPVAGLDDFYNEAYMDELSALGLSTRDGQHLEKYLGAVTESEMAIEAWIPIETPSS